MIRGIWTIRAWECKTVAQNQYRFIQTRYTEWIPRMAITSALQWVEENSNRWTYSEASKICQRCSHRLPSLSEEKECKRTLLVATTWCMILLTANSFSLVVLTQTLLSLRLCSFLQTLIHSLMMISSISLQIDNFILIIHVFSSLGNDMIHSNVEILSLL